MMGGEPLPGVSPAATMFALVAGSSGTPLQPISVECMGSEGGPAGSSSGGGPAQHVQQAQQAQQGARQPGEEGEE